MGVEARLVPQMRQTQQLVMTPQLRQAIKILQVSRAELEALIDQELCENPVLEETATLDEKPDQTDYESPTVDGPAGTTEAYEAEPPPETPQADNVGEIDWREFAENYSNDLHEGTGGGSHSEDDDERRPALENILVKRQQLSDHLLWQVRLSDLSMEEKELAALIVGSLDSDGFLSLSVDEIAFLANLWPDTSMVERVLARLQELDPPGVAARDLQECLLIQLRQLGCDGDSHAARIVRDHLTLLENRRLDRIAKDLNISMEQVGEAVKLIHALEPKPGRDFTDGETRYVTPDVTVHKVGDEFVVTLNEEGLPRLRVSRFYRQQLGTGTGEAKSYIQEKMRAAAWLIKSIHQRQRTLYLVTSSIVKFQSEFLERGVSQLRPLVLKDVANDIGMHESTVSRATAGKYVHTPQGTFELKYFFTAGLRAGHGEEVSSESVKEKIKTIIGKEDARKPLSDQFIAEVLGKEGIDIARRTVAKYRELMGILPSSKRKKVV